MNLTKTQKCIDSDTQVTTSTMTGQMITCGNCGQQVATHGRSGDANLIQYVQAHSQRV